MDPSSPLNNSTRTTHLTYLLLPSVFPQKTAGVEFSGLLGRLRREQGKVRLGRRMSSPGIAATPREEAQTLQHVAGVSVCPLRPGLQPSPLVLVERMPEKLALSFGRSRGRGRRIKWRKEHIAALCQDDLRIASKEPGSWDHQRELEHKAKFIASH